MDLFRRPLFPLVIAYIAGIICAAGTDMHPIAGFGVAGGLFLLGFVVHAEPKLRLFFGILVCIFAVGFVRTSVFRQAPPGDISEYAKGKNVYLTGTVASDPEPLGGRVRFTIKACRVKTYTGEFATSGNVMVTLYNSRKGNQTGRMPFYGEIVRIHGRLRRPEPPSNPGAPDYGRFLAHKRIFAMLSAGVDDTVALNPARWTPGWVAAKFKAAMTARALALFSPVHAMLLLGILLGNYASLPLEVQSSFMRSGTMHLLAASGYNCGVVVGILAWFLHRATVPRQVTRCLLILVLWLFVLVVGPSPSIVRAATMLSVFLAAFLLNRAPDMINTLLFSCLAILGVNPLSLFDVGFQLSFAAVASIILIMPILEPRLPVHTSRIRGGRWRVFLIRLLFNTSKTIILALAISIVATLGTWPITAYYFNYFSVVSVIANAFTALLVILLTWFGIMALGVGMVSTWLGRVIAVFASGIAGSILGVVGELGSYSWSCISVRSPSPVLIVVYYAALFGVLKYAYRKAATVKGKSGNSHTRSDSSLDMVSGS